MNVELTDQLKASLIYKLMLKTSARNVFLGLEGKSQK